MSNHVFETSKNSVMPHRKNMFKTAYDIAMATMCAYPPSKYSLPHSKYVLRCCEQCPCIDLPSPESDQYSADVSPKIRFQVYHLIKCCTLYVRNPLN